jgi:hypothetical protein
VQCCACNGKWKMENGRGRGEIRMTKGRRGNGGE